LSGTCSIQSVLAPFSHTWDDETNQRSGIFNIKAPVNAKIQPVIYYQRGRPFFG
jgi:hypothetical protein